MPGKKQITIVGGGVAGLALGIALRRDEVPVILHEASVYPRHRVCGEFLSGVRESTIEALGISEALERAETLRSTAWFGDSSLLLRADLPDPARGLSRYEMDRSLARLFVSLGGELRTRSRPRLDDLPVEATVLATGRPLRKDSDWIGLKAHFTAYRPDADLEMHLGDGGYLGIGRIENGRVNACGLFRRRREVKDDPSGILLRYLEAVGLSTLARNLRSSRIDPDSCIGVSAFVFGEQAEEPEPRFRIGDCGAIIPPFTGNGMSMALESAETSLASLLSFAHGEASWDEAISAHRERSSSRFGRRLSVAGWMHPLLGSRFARNGLRVAAAARLLPFRLLYRATR